MSRRARDGRCDGTGNFDGGGLSSRSRWIKRRESEAHLGGNKRVATHDAFGSDVVDQAQELVAPILEANPQLHPERNGPAVLRYAINLARISRVYVWLFQQPDPVFKHQRSGTPHKIYEYLAKWERAASAEEDRLAISPLTRARLGLDLAKTADLAKAMSEPDPARRRELLAEAGYDEEPEDR